MSDLSQTPTVIIRDPEFLRDLRYSLRPNVTISMGQLDEAIASGLGFSSRAALLAKLIATLPLQVDLLDQQFRERLQDFQTVAPAGLFLTCAIASTPSAFGEVLIGYRGEQEMARGRVKVKLSRVPTEEELEAEWLDFETLMPAFRRHAISMDPMIAIAIDLGGTVDIDGFRISTSSPDSWLTVIGPAEG